MPLQVLTLARRALRMIHHDHVSRLHPCARTSACLCSNAPSPTIVQTAAIGSYKTGAVGCEPHLSLHKLHPDLYIAASAFSKCWKAPRLALLCRFVVCCTHEVSCRSSANSYLIGPRIPASASACAFGSRWCDCTANHNYGSRILQLGSCKLRVHCYSSPAANASSSLSSAHHC